MNFLNLGVGEGVLAVIAMVVALFPAWRICVKTGHSGAFAILLLIPFVNILLILYMAFSEWPIERELSRLRAERL